MVETIGYIGLHHSHRRPYLESLGQLPVEITCACEPDEGFDLDRVTELDLDAVPLYRDPSALLASEDVDAVWVTLPNRDTPAVLEAAIEHGVHAFVEKSLARTAADLEPVAAAARGSAVTIAAAYVNRADPVNRELRDRRAAGFFGDLRAFDARLVKNKLAARLRSERQPDFLYTRGDARGGILQWLGCHYLDLLEWLLDDPIVRVNARTSRGVAAVDTEDGALVSLETASGAHGSLGLGYYFADGPEDRGDTAVGPSPEPLAIYGMDGAAVVAPDGETLRLGADTAAWAGAPTRTLSFDTPEVAGYGGQAGLDYFRAFCELCAGGESDLVATIEDELRVLRILDAAYESAETDRWVAVE